MDVPLDTSITNIVDIPHTISFVIRKRQQIDNLMELPKEKRPDEFLIWEGSSDDLEEWIERVFNTKEKHTTELILADVEG